MSRPVFVLASLAFASLGEMWFFTSRDLPRPSLLRDAMRVSMEHAAGPMSIQEMQDLARREAQGLVTIRNADGSETLNHEGRFREFTVVRVGPDGKPVYRCVHGEAGAAHAARPAVPADPKREER